MSARLASAVTVALVASAAWAQTPRVVGSAAELGNWNLASAPAMRDDGTNGDLVGGDGVWTARVTFAAANEYQYKISVNGTDFTGALGSNNFADNMRIRVAAGATVTFTYDTRNRGVDGWLPADRSISDSATATTKVTDGTPATWIFVGDFQAAIGDGTNFNQNSTRTVARDDGTGGDRVAGDGILTYSFRVPTGTTFTNTLYKLTQQGGWWTKFGANGYSFDPADASNGTFSATAGQVVTMEFDARHGRMRTTVVNVSASGKLLLSEVVVSPSAHEYIEIYNPGSAPIDLGNFYLADVGGTSTATTDARYFDVTAATKPTTMSANDIIARFPDGAFIRAGEYQTVSFGGAACFRNGSDGAVGNPCGGTASGFAVNPTYELPQGTATTKMLAEVPKMRFAWATSAPSGNLGTGSSFASLTDGGEPVVLFYWDGASATVRDVDYVYYGTPATTGDNVYVNKTGVAGYVNDAPQSTGAPVSGTGTVRRDYGEGTSLTPPAPQVSPGNGITNQDETSESVAQTWRSVRNPTPNAATVNVIEPNPATISLAVGASQAVTARTWADLGKTAELTGRTLTFAKSPSGATSFNISPTSGTATTVTAVAAGTTDRLSVSADAVTAQVAVTVTYGSITVTCTPGTVDIGQTSTCTAVARDNAGAPLQTQPTFTWSIKTGSAATVNASGVVTGTAVGTVTVAAKGAGDPTTEGTHNVSITQGSFSAVVVTCTPRAIKHSEVSTCAASARLQGGAVANPQPTFTWSIVRGDAGTINASTGVFTGHATRIGIVTVAARPTTGQDTTTTGTFDIAVGDLPVATAIVLSPASQQLVVGRTGSVSAQVVDQRGSPMATQPTFTYTVANPAVATISAAGLVTAVSLGTTKFHVTGGTLRADGEISVVEGGSGPNRPLPGTTGCNCSSAPTSVASLLPFALLAFAAAARRRRS